MEEEGKSTATASFPSCPGRRPYSSWGEKKEREREKGKERNRESCWIIRVCGFRLNNTRKKRKTRRREERKTA